MIVTSRPTLAPVTPIMRDKVTWYVTTRLDGIVGCTAAIPSYDLCCDCAPGHFTEIMVNGVLTVEAGDFRSAFGVVAYLFGFDFYQSRGNWSGPLLTIPVIHGQLCCRLFSMPALRLLGLVQSVWAPHGRFFSRLGASYGRSHKIVVGIPSSCTVPVLAVALMMRY